MISKERLDNAKRGWNVMFNNPNGGFDLCLESALEADDAYRLSHPVEESEGEPRLHNNLVCEDGVYKYHVGDGDWTPINWAPLDIMESAVKHYAWRESQQKTKVGEVTDAMELAYCKEITRQIDNGEEIGIEGRKKAIQAALKCQNQPTKGTP